MTTGYVVHHWFPGKTTLEETQISTTIQRQEPTPRTCYHVMARQANIVVETMACGDGNTIDHANEIPSRILAKFPQ